MRMSLMLSRLAEPISIILPQKGSILAARPCPNSGQGSISAALCCSRAWCSADRRRPVLGEVGSWLSSEILHGNAEHTGCARPGGGSDPPIDRVIAQNR